jgi:hypothetical protein
MCNLTEGPPHFSYFSAASVQGALHGAVAKVRLSLQTNNLQVDHGDIVDSAACLGDFTAN